MFFTNPSGSIATPLLRLLAGEFAGVFAGLPPVFRTTDVLFRSFSFDGVRVSIGMGDTGLASFMADSELLSGDADCEEAGLAPLMAEPGLPSGEPSCSELRSPTRATDSGLPRGEPIAIREHGLLPFEADSGLLIGDDDKSPFTGEEALSGAVPSRRCPPFAA